MRDFIGQFFKKTALSQQASLPLNKWPAEWKEVRYKSYPRFEFIGLNKFKPNTLIEKTLLSRRSKRTFASKNISLDLLNKILYFSARLNKKTKDVNVARRPYPSAGARYPLEMYVIARKVSKLKRGIYHFDVYRNALTLLSQDTIDNSLQKMCFDDFVFESSIILIITAVPTRSSIKYDNRSLRYMFLEAGHLAQNILLLVAVYGRRACPIGGFNDLEVSRLLRLGRTEEKPVYMIALG